MNSVILAVKDLSARAVVGIVEGNLIDRGFHADRRSELEGYYLIVVWLGAECRHIGVHKQSKNLIVIEENQKRYLTLEQTQAILKGSKKDEILSMLWPDVQSIANLTA